MNIKSIILIVSLLTIFGYSLIAQPKAIIKNSFTKYEILSKGRVEISHDYEMVINNKNALRHATFVDYYDKFKKIRKLEMIILDQNGEKIKKLNKSDAFDLNINNSYEIDDSRILVLEPDYSQYPFTIVVSTVSTFEGFISLPTWIPRIGYDVEVQNSRLEIEYPIGYKINILEEHITRISDFKNDKTEVISWEVNYLEAVTHEVNKTTFYNSQPKVIVAPLNFELDGISGSFENWSSFGNWFLQLNQGRDELLPETKKYLENLNGLSNEDLIKEIYHYMQDKTRYISIQLGIGGFQTIPSDVVEKTGYGDCKALTNYMKAMLGHVNITSNYILVRAGANAADIKEDFPSNQFNHVFLGVPLKEDTVLLECTSQMTPVNYIGRFTDDRNVLWIEKNQSKVIRSRKYSEKENTKLTSGEIFIDGNGNARILAETSNTGVFYDELMRYKYVTNEEAKQHHYKKFNYKDFTINELSFSEPYRDSIDFKLHFDVTISGLAKKSLDKMLIPMNLWLPINSYLEVNNISSSVEIKRGFRVYNEFELKVPENYWQNKMPEDRVIDSEFGNYRISIEWVDGKYLIKREVIIKKGLYDEERYELFNNFLKKIKRADNAKIVMDSRT